MNDFVTEMPYLREMDRILQEKAQTGTLGVRLFVQKNSDLSPDDVARDFRAMELARIGNPYYTALCI